MTSELDGRLSRIERRLSAIETLMRQSGGLGADSPSPEPVVPPRPVAMPPRPPRPAPAATATNFLGWAGAIALVLAATYLIRLAIDTGWLTPTIQVGCAGLFGLALIGAGLMMRDTDRRYAGLLPGAGIVVLFLTIYGSHLSYHLIDARAAGAAVVVVCLASLWLGELFESDLYALFAVVGSYSAPFLLAEFQGSFTDLAIYYSAWSVTFSVFSVFGGQRAIYLIALYAALIGFDVFARGGAVAWGTVVSFQAVQFVIFGVAAMTFSIRHKSPMDTSVAALHLPPLVLFYALQYYVLKQHVPGAAPWIAVASLVALLLLVVMTRIISKRPSPGGEFLAWAYATLVLFHAGYIESVPAQWAPWVAAVVAPLVAWVSIRRPDASSTMWPLWAAAGFVFIANLLRIFFTPGPPVLGFVYALLLYAGYALTRRKPLLYVGHLTTMVASLHLLHDHFLQSVAWGLLALGCLGLSLARRDRDLGQSSLFVFGATAVKVLLYDLSGAPPIARIIGLIVLGVTFYVGGMLYQRTTATARA
jgi:uncharacterized membrane protein